MAWSTMQELFEFGVNATLQKGRALQYGGTQIQHEPALVNLDS